MDKNTIIGFVLIGIVLFAAVFAWQYFGAKKERAAA